MDVTIPPNTTATVYVPALGAKPDSSVDGLTESGKAIAAAKGVKFLRMDKGTAVLALESGTYHFVRN